MKRTVGQELLEYVSRPMLDWLAREACIAWLTFDGRWAKDFARAAAERVVPIGSLPDGPHRWRTTPHAPGEPGRRLQARRRSPQTARRGHSGAAQLRVTPAAGRGDALTASGVAPRLRAGAAPTASRGSRPGPGCRDSTRIRPRASSANGPTRAMVRDRGRRRAGQMGRPRRRPWRATTLRPAPPG